MRFLNTAGLESLLIPLIKGGEGAGVGGFDLLAFL
jgi:hypothetical protein